MCGLMPVRRKMFATVSSYAVAMGEKKKKKKKTSKVSLRPAGLMKLGGKRTGSELKKHF